MFNKKILCIITLIVLVILIYFYIKNYNEKFETSTTTGIVESPSTTTGIVESTSTTTGIVESTSTTTGIVESPSTTTGIVESPSTTTGIENENKKLTRLELIEAQKKFEEKEKQILLEEELNRIELNKTKITYPEITILKEALKENDNKLYNIRYDSLSKQDKLNELTKRLNNINYSISSLKQNPQYKASGELKFY